MDLDATIKRFQDVMARIEPVIPVLEHIAQFGITGAATAAGGPLGGAAAGAIGQVLADFEKVGGAGILQRIVADLESLKKFRDEVQPLVGQLGTIIKDLQAPQNAQAG